MAVMMMFPETVEEFMESYKIVDTDEVYTNGTELVPIFRMKQWFEHIDAVPVVRCKDCEHFEYMCTCTRNGIRISRVPNDYCSRGEKRNEDRTASG